MILLLLRVIFVYLSMTSSRIQCDPQSFGYIVHISPYYFYTNETDTYVKH